MIWLLPLFIDNGNKVIKTTLSYQIVPFSLPSNTSLSTISILTESSSMNTVVSNEKHFSLLKWSVRVIGCLLIIVGGIGNILSALTLRRKKLRIQVTSIYLIALALSDLGRNNNSNFHR